MCQCNEQNCGCVPKSYTSSVIYDGLILTCPDLAAIKPNCTSLNALLQAFGELICSGNIGPQGPQGIQGIQGIQGATGSVVGGVAYAQLFETNGVARAITTAYTGWNTTTLGENLGMTYTAGAGVTPSIVTCQTGYEGVYQISAALSLSVDTNNVDVYMVVELNGLPIASTEVVRKFDSGEIGSFSMTELVDLSVGDTLGVYYKRVGGGVTVNITPVNFSVDFVKVVGVGATGIQGPIGTTGIQGPNGADGVVYEHHGLVSGHVWGLAEAPVGGAMTHVITGVTGNYQVHINLNNYIVNSGVLGFGFLANFSLYINGVQVLQKMVNCPLETDGSHQKDSSMIWRGPIAQGQIVEVRTITFIESDISTTKGEILINKEA